MTDPDHVRHLAAGRHRPPLHDAEPRPHVLIVDDDPHIRSLETAVLSMHGFTSTACASGLDALRAFDEESFDAVLLDLRMPGIDGWEVLRTLRIRGFHAPVLIVSADATLVEATELGADGVLRKPFSVAELVGVLTSVLRGQRLWGSRGRRASGNAESSALDREYLLARAG